MTTQFIIILNDGTDEIFNMHYIECQDWTGFRDQYRKIFGEYDPNNKTYLLVPNRETLDCIMGLSNKMEEHAEWEIGILECLNFKTYNQLQRIIHEFNLFGTNPNWLKPRSEKPRK